MTPLMPKDEAARLEALRRYEVLDTPREEDFDEIVRLAAQICNTPVSLISLVDEKRQWFKGRQGVDVAQTPRDVSFCGHAIVNAPDLMIVPDSAKDPRFKANPLVNGEPNIRFYAGAPLVTPDGHAIGTLCVIDHQPRELTETQKDGLRILSRQVVTQLELRRHLRSLSRAARELADANVELEGFSCAISHDLRGPLRTIIGFSEVLRQHCPGHLDAEGKTLLAQIERSGQRMAEILDDFLRLMRLRKRSLEETTFDMRKLVEEVVEELRTQAGDWKTKIRIGELPVACGDKGLIHQVWVNLISNALKFSRNHPTPRIEIGGKEEPGRFLFFVKDNGVGFEMEYADKLWAAFGRLHGKDFEGTGLGLSIVQRIVQRHGGTVWAEGAPNAGATFWFALPRPEAEACKQAVAA